MEQREKILYDTKGKGRPGIKVDTIEDSTFRITKDQTSDSSAVKLKHIQGISVAHKKKQATEIGLDPGRTKVNRAFVEMSPSERRNLRSKLKPGSNLGML